MNENYLGYSVSISDDYAIVVTPYDDGTNLDSAYIFEYKQSLVLSETLK